MFEQVVFAGGGNRCGWQAGWWDVVAPAVDLKPRVIAGVSAGAATACMPHANDSRWTMDYYREALEHNRSNAYWGNCFGARAILRNPTQRGSSRMRPSIVVRFTTSSAASASRS